MSGSTIRSADACGQEPVRFDFNVIPGILISDEQFEENSSFFSTHYGIWGPLVTFAKPGTCAYVQ